jgi:sugar-specific transcriptional regulator TrmB
VQARVYLALVKYEDLKISGIAKVANVARPDVYRNLSKLEELGLIEKIIDKPQQYRAIPMKRGLLLLLEGETQHYEKIRAETRMLLTAATTKKSIKKEQTEKPQFILIPKGRTVIEEIRTAIEKAGQSVILVLSWKRFSQGITSVFAESMEIAWAKNVKIRLLMEYPPESKTAEQLIGFCREKPCCQIRFIPHYPKTVFGIYDDKEIFIVVKSETDLRGSSALWSNNRDLIALAKDYFETLWLTSARKPKTLKSTV